MGVDVASFGDAHAATEGALEVAVNDAVAGTYKKLVVTDDGRTLLGGVLVGDAAEYNTLRALVGRPLPADPGALLAPPVAVRRSAWTPCRTRRRSVRATGFPRGR